MTLEELLAELNKLDRAQVVGGLQTYSQPIYQAVFDKGHSTATVKHNTEKQALEVQVNTLTETVRQKDAQLATANEKAPDIAVLRQQHEAQIRDLQEKNDAKVKAKNDELITERRDRAVTNLRVKLVEQGVDPEYAEVLSLKPDVQKRIRLNAEGKPEVFQADSDIPFAPAKGKTGIDLLAEELTAGTPPKFVVSNADRGSETTSRKGGGPAKGSLYDEIRSEAEKRQTSDKPKPLTERFGMQPSA
jgi:hypothetical protein